MRNPRATLKFTSQHDAGTPGTKRQHKQDGQTIE